MQFFNKSPEGIERDAEKQIKVRKAEMKAFGQLTDIELEKLELEEKLMPKQDRIDRLRANNQGMRRLQKGSWTFQLSAFAMSFVSSLTTIAGITGTHNIWDFRSLFGGQDAIFSMTAFLLQLVLFNFNKFAYIVKLKHYKDYSSIRIFQAMVLVMSVYGNFQYYYIVEQKEFIYSSLMAVSLDLGNLVFSALGTNSKYRIQSKPDTSAESKSRFEKFLALASDKLFGWIDRCYDEKFSLKTVANNDKTGISLTDRLLEKIEQAPSETVITKSFLGLEDKPLEWREIKDIAKDKGLCRATNNKFIRN